MTDLNDFEQQLASGLDQIAGPRRPIDALAISRDAIARSPRWSFQSTFNATRFVVAGFIVALFGGFLLAGVLTQPSDEGLPVVGASASARPEPTAAVEADGSTTNPNLLPGVDLVTEEVEPGVFRVINDGHRDLAWVGDPASYAVRHGATVPGRDGGVWNFALPVAPDDDCRATIGGEDPDRYGCMTFYRLGAPETHRLADGSVLSSVAVAEDGTVWDLSGLRSFDGSTWMAHQLPENFAWSVVMGPNGNIWATWPDQRDRERLGRLTEGRWEVSGPGPTLRNQPFLFTGAEREVYRVSDGGVIRRIEDLDRRPQVAHAEGLDLGWGLPQQGGGIFWWIVTPDDDGTKRLVRSNGSETTSYDWPHRQGEGRIVGVAPDGAVWLAAGLLALRCDGITRFDGSESRHFLSGACPVSVDIGTDGTVWLQAIPSSEQYEQTSVVDTYVITPEDSNAAE